ncbi:MAG: SusD/RagB family nutrient-binding outer membrane lipoprotein [Gemmatimonadales bacterium]|nr:MAG: SusD/RagB family nutrient-binding outer membrane lipoprotein [Gemmatimonadales bacterium]
MMTRFKQMRTAAVAALAVGVTGCGDLLSGPGLSENPNSPVEASTEALLIATQARTFVLQSGQLARQSSIWTQQIAGIFNQQLEWGSQYNVTENDMGGHFAGFYTGGGLLDMRRVRDAGVEAGDARLEGIAKVLEGLHIGTAASIWGDIPYREAVNADISAPILDPQEQVYADVQQVLSDAISLLGTASSASLASDLIYNGDSQRWLRAAHTLKARYHLHVAPRVGQSAYEAALAAAQQGINEAPASALDAINGQGPGDFRAFHGNTLDDGNIWSQFYEARSDLAANARMIGVLVAREDPRLDVYFNPANDGQWRGANQFGLGPAPWSPLDQENRLFRTFRQPIVTWAENQFIMAEAHYQLGRPGDALTHVNNVRTAIGMAALGGPITLEQIMVEKWIAQFQNVDAYSDYRRTCFPRLIPGGPNPQSPAAQIPGRLPYGNSERLQNPNVPPPSAQPDRNWNFENVTCPTSGGTI